MISIVASDVILDQILMKFLNAIKMNPLALKGNVPRISTSGMSVRHNMILDLTEEVRQLRAEVEDVLFYVS